MTDSFIEQVLDVAILLSANNLYIELSVHHVHVVYLTIYLLNHVYTSYE